MGAYATWLWVAMLLPGAAAAEPVSLVMSFHLEGGPQYRACEVAVASGANVIHLLDTALDSGCIDGWRSSSRTKNVDCIDGLCGLDGWRLFINGEPRDGWFYEHPLAAGDDVELVLDEVQSTLNSLNNG